MFQMTAERCFDWGTKLGLLFELLCTLRLNFVRFFCKSYRYTFLPPAIVLKTFRIIIYTIAWDFIVHIF